MIFNDLLAGAMRLLGVLAAGATPSGDETQDGFLACNLMLDSWSIELLNIFTTGVASYPLTSNKSQYLIGLGAVDFNAARPARIEKAAITVPNPGGAGVLRTPLTLVPFALWQTITELGSAGTTSKSLYYDYGMPYGGLNLHPVPTWTAGSGNVRSLELYTWTALAQFPDFVTDVPLSAGYGRALQHALALEIAPQYLVPITEILSLNAAQAKAAIRSLNGTMPGAEPEAQPLDMTPAQAPPQSQGQ